MKHVSLFALAAASALGALPALAADADLHTLREEIAQMRKSYEQRIEALEKRLVQAEATSAQAKTAADKAATQTARAGEGKANAFNPEIGLNLQGALTKTTRDPAKLDDAGLCPAGRARRDRAAPAARLHRAGNRADGCGQCRSELSWLSQPGVDAGQCCRA
jgi:hypothetical protein